jgi:hypothetical protein
MSIIDVSVGSNYFQVHTIRYKSRKSLDRLRAVVEVFLKFGSPSSRSDLLSGVGPRDTAGAHPLALRLSRLRRPRIRFRSGAQKAAATSEPRGAPSKQRVGRAQPRAEFPQDEVGRLLDHEAELLLVEQREFARLERPRM